MESERNRRAFTLIELLIVIGIIGVLVAILLPALNKAREQGRRVTCLSNMRAIGTAFQMYTAANNDMFPWCAAGTTTTPTPLPTQDWIYWQPSRCPDSRFAYGQIPRIMGGHVPISQFRCPSDEIASHGTLRGAQYPYSYTVNFNICGGKVYTAPMDTFRSTQIVHPAEKILLIDEDGQTVDDGAWAPQKTSLNEISNRHSRRFEDTANLTGSAGEGNVVFADGHGETILRANGKLPAYYDPNQP